MVEVDVVHFFEENLGFLPCQVDVVLFRHFQQRVHRIATERFGDGKARGSPAYIS